MFYFRFTELFVEELENESDLRILVADYLKGLNLSKSVINGIIRSASSLCSKQNLFPYRILKNSIAFEATSSYKMLLNKLVNMCVVCFCLAFTSRFVRRPTPTWWAARVRNHTTVCAHSVVLSSMSLPTPATASSAPSMR